jgi:hypothetical protein
MGVLVLDKLYQFDFDISNLKSWELVHEISKREQFDSFIYFSV